MINNHIPVMLEEVKIHIPNNKKINILDATFGGGGYSKSILEEFILTLIVRLTNFYSIRDIVVRINKYQFSIGSFGH